MRSGMIAVWDPDRGYGEKLSEYLRRQGRWDLTVVSFGDVEKLRLAVECGQVAVAVIGQQEGGAIYRHRSPVHGIHLPFLLLY